MASKMRNALITIAVMLFTVSTVSAKKRDFDSSIFDKSSDFMKGFETGILVRSKKGDPNKFGFKIMSQGEEAHIGKAVDAAKKSMNAVKLMLPALNHDSMEEVIDLVIEGLAGISKLAKAVNPDYGQKLYCRGMIFGLEGSKILVRIANIIHKN